ncbi:MAG: di-heme oxidoredictase family protein, partial [Polyangiaceae bacterium]
MKIRTTRFLPHALWISALGCGSLAACSGGSYLSQQDFTASDSGTTEGGDTTATGDPFDNPIAGISSDLLSEFFRGDSEFDLVLRPYDGLGPLYTRSSCGGCHSDGNRGPGLVQKMVVVGADGITPVADQASFLPFGNTEHPLVVTDIPGVKTPVLPPDFDGGIDGGPAPDLRVSIRLGPPVLGRGYMEAIDDSEILRMESEQATRSDGIHGHVNHLMFASQPNPDPTYDSHQTGDQIIGRFGLKARIVTLDEFTADALQGDMGVTSPMRPTEIANPDGITDDLKPGVDLTADEMNVRAMYLRLLAIPKRDTTSAGQALFEQVKCSVCHAESLKTRADYPIPQLAGIDAPVFTDMLLHDMGDTLSDSVT